MTITTKTRRLMHASTGGRCFYCGRWLAPESLSKSRDWLCLPGSSLLNVEHRDSVIRGGSDDRENFLPACWPCNALKRSRSLEEFRLLLGLRKGHLPHVFACEQAQVARDFIVVVSHGHQQSLLEHNFPGCKPLGGGVGGRAARAARREATSRGRSQVL